AGHQREVLGRLDRFDRARLSETGGLHADLYEPRLRGGGQGYALRPDLFALTQRGGVQPGVSIFDLLPFATRDDFDHWSVRVERWPAKVDATIAVLREAIARKMLWQRIVMERVPEQI